MNSQELSGTPCPPLPPPPPRPRPPVLPARSIFLSNQLFIPLLHHTMGGTQRRYVQALWCTQRVYADTHTHTFKRRICEELMPVVDYIHTKAIFSFIKNKRKAASEIFTRSRDEEEHGDLEAQRFSQTKGQRRLFLVIR